MVGNGCDLLPVTPCSYRAVGIVGGVVLFPLGFSFTTREATHGKRG